MKAIKAIILLLLLVGSVQAASETYVTILADAQATLSNGATFTLHEGDSYPFLGYDPQQAFAQLKLGPLTFWASKSNIAFISEADTPAAAKKYVVLATKFFEGWQAAVQQGQQQGNTVQRMQDYLNLMKNIEETGQKRNRR
jgi:hypothetical protein